jgi:hypothetical protein
MSDRWALLLYRVAFVAPVLGKRLPVSSQPVLTWRSKRTEYRQWYDFLTFYKYAGAHQFYARTYRGDNAISIATVYGVRRPRDSSSSPGSGKIFLITTSTKPAEAASLEVYRIDILPQIRRSSQLNCILGRWSQYRSRNEIWRALWSLHASLYLHVCSLFGPEDGGRTFPLNAVEFQWE